MEIVNFCATHKLDAGKLWSLFNDGGAWRSYMTEGGLSADEISDGRALLYAAARGEIAKPAAPAATISGADPSRTAPAAALKRAPAKPEPESATALWDRVLGIGTQAAAAQPESVQGAAPAPETGADEGARLRAILSCQEAKGRPRLAEHIACRTSLDVDAARAALAASPIEAKAAPAARPEPVAAGPTEALVPCRPDQAAHPDSRAAKEQSTNALWRRAIERTERKGRLA